MPRDASRDDTAAYTVPCGFCGALKGEPCVTVNPSPRDPSRVDYVPPRVDPETPFLQRRRLRLRGVAKPCGKAHIVRVHDAQRWAYWHHGIAPEPPHVVS